MFGLIFFSKKILSKTNFLIFLITYNMKNKHLFFFILFYFYNTNVYTFPHPYPNHHIHPTCTPYNPDIFNPHSDPRPSPCIHKYKHTKIHTYIYTHTHTITYTPHIQKPKNVNQQKIHIKTSLSNFLKQTMKTQSFLTKHAF